MQSVQATRDQFLQDVLSGLAATPKRIPCKYFYDTPGSKLFEQICQLPEYYLTRAEAEIMEHFAAEMAACMGPRIRLIEFGSGNSAKTRILLDALDEPSVYVPVDISHNHLLAASSQLAAEYPGIEVVPVAADYSAAFPVPESSSSFRRTIAYSPGSTIGNMNDAEAGSFLKSVRNVVSHEGALLIGMDLAKDAAILEAAYDDEAGITARFNLNLLERMRRQLGAEVVPANFSHVIRYDQAGAKIEMFLRSSCDQTILVEGSVFKVLKGEMIHTESCRKYTEERASGLAAQGGFAPRRTWYDARRYFSVQYWEAGPRA